MGGPCARGQRLRPGERASRQRAVLEALREGPQRVAELSATIPGAASAVTALAKRGVVEVFSRRSVRGSEATSLSSAAAPRPERLTAGQAEALAAIDAAREEAAGGVVLVDGVTGSGKTEVYLDAIERALAGGRGAIVLVPEISLTAQTVGRFRGRFGEDVAVLHSRLSTGERFDQWDLVRRGAGPRGGGRPLGALRPAGRPRSHHHRRGARGLLQAGFLPALPRPRGGRPHGRRARVRPGAGKRHALPGEPGPLSRRPLPGPPLDAREHAGAAGGRRPSQGDHRGHGRAVRAAAAAGSSRRLWPTRSRSVCERREKAVLLLNQPRVCQLPHVPRVRVRAGVPALQLRRSPTTSARHSLMCHTCGRAWPVRAYPDPSTCCPNCGSRYMGAYGVGTQRVEDELHALLPEGVDGHPHGRGHHAAPRALTSGSSSSSTPRSARCSSARR